MTTANPAKSTGDVGRIWVADREKHRVLCFDAATKQLSATFGGENRDGWLAAANDLEVFLFQPATGERKPLGALKEAANSVEIGPDGAVYAAARGLVSKLGEDTTGTFAKGSESRDSQDRLCVNLEAPGGVGGGAGNGPPIRFCELRFLRFGVVADVAVDDCRSPRCRRAGHARFFMSGRLAEAASQRPFRG